MYVETINKESKFRTLNENFDFNPKNCNLLLIIFFLVILLTEKP